MPCCLSSRKNRSAFPRAVADLDLINDSRDATGLKLGKISYVLAKKLHLLKDTNGSVSFFVIQKLHILKPYILLFAENHCPLVKSQYE